MGFARLFCPSPAFEKNEKICYDLEITMSGREEYGYELVEERRAV